MSVSNWFKQLVPSLGILCAISSPAQATVQDYLVTANRPNNVQVVDLKTEKVVRTCKVPDHISPGVVVMSPDKSTAFVLAGHWENIYGINIDSCKVTFSAKQSTSKERVKTITSLAVSPDNKQVYSIQTPTFLGKNEYKVLPPRFAVFNVADGLNAKAVKTFPAPRQITTMATGADGTVYAAGAHIYAIDPVKGSVDIKIKMRDWGRKNMTNPDALAVWPIGDISKEFLIMYMTAKFKDDKQDMATAEWLWGYSRVDLTTGEAEQREFAPFEVIMFTGITHPKDKNTLYGILSQLTKHDIKTGKVIKRVDLDHSFYCINMSSSGDKIYIGGTLNTIEVYDSENLEKLSSIQLPGGDQGAATVQVFAREALSTS